MSSQHWDIPKRTHTDLIDQLLENRGVADRDRFLHPDFVRDSHDPLLMPNIDLAVSRILAAIEKREQIAVFADYDADGIPGGALLTKLLRANNVPVVYYIPNRLTEGYGLNTKALDALKAQNIGLVITVDLGITNRAEVAHAAAIGMDVIVTDHHHIDTDRLPIDAVAVVHPALEGSRYPFAGLAGGGVAWKLAQAISARTGKPTEAELKWWLELAAISTVCDIMPLLDENRTIVHFGLKVLQRTRNVGLQALYGVGGITATDISARTIGFQIGPRLNAPGRTAGSSVSIELLTTDDSGEAAKLAATIEGYNQTRRSSVDQMIKESQAQVAAFGSPIPPAVIVANDQWSVGLAGLVAARLAQDHSRPAIAFAQGGSGTLKGSARSVQGLNILALIANQREHLLTYGGHEQAAGLQLHAGALPAFKAAFLGSMAGIDRSTPTVRADAQLDPGELSLELAQSLEQLAPFGEGNPRPLFLVTPVTLRSIQAIGANQTHARFSFRDQSWGGIGFGLASEAMQYTAGDQVSLLGHIGVNRWNGTTTLQLEVVAIRPASTVAD